MPGDRHRRITWKLRRVATGWLPVVLIGEEPFTMAALPTKAAARKQAKRTANQMRLNNS